MANSYHYKIRQHFHHLGTLSRLSNACVMVIGDLMLDTYTIGQAKRISPEAPVAVVHVQNEEHRPGGSGNVILNLLSLGMNVIAVGRVGNDFAGDFLCSSLSSEGISLKGIVKQGGYQTPNKKRVIAENQQVVRIDYEHTSPLPEMLEQEIIEKLPSLLNGVKVIAISDYGKGFLTRQLLEALIQLANSLNIPVITDPKGIDFSKYQHTTIIKPNLSEAILASGLPSTAPLESIAQKIIKHSQAEMALITRGGEGISLFHKNGKHEEFPPLRLQEVKDVTGAGDTVLAMLTCALASGLILEEAIPLSNIAAGIAIEHIGCARVTLDQLAQRLLDFDSGNKVFDEYHLFALQHVLKEKPFILVGLSYHHGFSTELFISLRDVIGTSTNKLMIYIQDENPPLEFIDLLVALRYVDFVMLKGDNLRKLCEKIHPKEIYHFDGKKCQHVQLEEVYGI